MSLSPTYSPNTLPFTKVLALTAVNPFRHGRISTRRCVAFTSCTWLDVSEGMLASAGCSISVLMTLSPGLSVRPNLIKINWRIASLPPSAATLARTVSGISPMMAMAAVSWR